MEMKKKIMRKIAAFCYEDIFFCFAKKQDKSICRRVQNVSFYMILKLLVIRGIK